jgi:hypothetical protein
VLQKLQNLEMRRPVGRYLPTLQEQRTTEIVSLKQGEALRAGFRNIEVYNITALSRVLSGVLFKSARTRGGYSRDVRIHDLTLVGVAIPIHITMNWNPNFSYATLPEGVKDIPSYWVTLTTKVPERRVCLTSATSISGTSKLPALKARST